MAETPATPSTDLAVIETAEDAVAALRGAVLPEIEDPETISTQIIERILSADNPDAVLSNTSAVGAKDVLGRPFMLHGVRLLRSRFDEGPGVFAVLDAEFLDDGERLAVTCSGRNVMAQAVQLWRLDALPQTVAISQSDTPTASGYNVLYLRKA